MFAVGRFSRRPVISKGIIIVQRFRVHRSGLAIIIALFIGNLVLLGTAAITEKQNRMPAVKAELAVWCQKPFSFQQAAVWRPNPEPLNLEP
jgi:hypothetical protein